MAWPELKARDEEVVDLVISMMVFKDLMMEIVVELERAGVVEDWAKVEVMIGIMLAPHSNGN